MSDRPIEFLVGPAKPQSLPDAIRRVLTYSAGFCQFWLSAERNYAQVTSEEAFSMLDHIQNELLRHRDAQSKLATWTTAPLNAALDTVIGKLITPATPADISAFTAQADGRGSLPTIATVVDLKLGTALNKLKHRSINVIKFSVSQTRDHALYIYTPAGMGQPDTLCGFDAHEFCQACKMAAQHV